MGQPCVHPPALDPDAPAADWSARRAGWLLLALVPAAALLRIALTRFIAGPAIFGDELLYVDQARGLAEAHRPLLSGHDPQFPNWLY